MRICACISGRNMENALNQIRGANREADMVEIRLDCITRPELERLLQECKKPVIVTFRSKGEGGMNKISERAGLELLEKALELNAEFVDIEFSLGAAKMGKLMAKNKKSKIILSHHNTKKTSSLKTMQGLAKRMDLLKPDIIKIACRANHEEDNIKLIQLILGAKERKNMVCFCTGEKGKVSRVVSPLIGNEIMFAAIGKGKETAEGQLTIGELKGVRRVVK